MSHLNVFQADGESEEEGKESEPEDVGMSEELSQSEDEAGGKGPERYVRFRGSIDEIQNKRSITEGPDNKIMDSSATGEPTHTNEFPSSLFSCCRLSSQVKEAPRSNEPKKPVPCILLSDSSSEKVCYVISLSVAVTELGSLP